MGDIVEFSKTLKISEYSVVKQLNKQPSQIYRLSLLLSSETHGDALLKNLNESYVPERIVRKDLKQIVGQIVGTNMITLNEDELTPEGARQVKPLHIDVECKEIIIYRVLIDNAFALNVCPIMTLCGMGVNYSFICPNGMMIWALMVPKLQSCGEIDLEVMIGLCVFETSFVVVDIPVVLNLLLGLPWIHSAGAITSSMH